MYDWDRQLGAWPAYQAFRQRFLQLTPHRAMSITCATDCGLSCPRRVIEHSPVKIIAACMKREEGSLTLTERDVLIYKVNGAALRRDICRALGIKHCESQVEGCRLTWRLGDYIPAAGKVFPVYLTHPDDAEEFCEVTRHLCLLAPGPFAVITPLRRDHSPIAEGLLARQQAVFLTLSEELVFSGEALLEAVRNPEDMFRALTGEAAETGSGGITGFNTPPGVSWEQIRIQFYDGHTVSIRIDDAAARRYSFSEMGMENSNTRLPNKQWQFLEDLALSGGKLDGKMLMPIASVRNRNRNCLEDYVRSSTWKMNPSSGWLRAKFMSACSKSFPRA